MLISEALRGNIAERKSSAVYQAAIRQLRRWRTRYHVTVDNVNIYGKQESRIFLNGKLLLKTTEVKKAVRQAYKSNKGGGYKQVSRNIWDKKYAVSTRQTNSELKSFDLQQITRPIFDNKAPLIPISASRVQHRHQIDLVSMNQYPVKKGKKTVSLCAERTGLFQQIPLALSNENEIEL